MGKILSLSFYLRICHKLFILSLWDTGWGIWSMWGKFIVLFTHHLLAQQCASATLFCSISPSWVFTTECFSCRAGWIYSKKVLHTLVILPFSPQHTTIPFSRLFQCHTQLYYPILHWSMNFLGSLPWHCLFQFLFSQRQYPLDCYYPVTKGWIFIVKGNT